MRPRRRPVRGLTQEQVYRLRRPRALHLATSEAGHAVRWSGVDGDEPESRVLAKGGRSAGRRRPIGETRKVRIQVWARPAAETSFARTAQPWRCGRPAPLQADAWSVA